MKRLFCILGIYAALFGAATVACAQGGALVKGTFKMVEGTVGKGWSSGISVAGMQRYVERQIIWSGMNQAQRSVWQSSFRARSPKDDEAIKSFSGTLFKYGADTYGVIAAHALVSDEQNPNIGRWFFADVFLDGQWTTVPAQVVQLSAPATWDVALVKFRPKDAARLQPLALSSRSLQLGDPLRVTGFHHQTPLTLSGQQVTELSPFSIRAPILGANIQRIGLCGSAVTNGQGELVGVHTGSKFGFDGDIGYATHAHILPKLVEGSKNNGQVFWPLELDGQKIADLRLDEYVYTIDFLGPQKEHLTKITFNGKFSYREVAEMLAQYTQTQYLELSTAYVSWKTENPNLLHLYTPARKLLYDLRTKSLVE